MRNFPMLSLFGTEGKGFGPFADPEKSFKNGEQPVLLAN